MSKELHYVEERLTYLNTLKKELIPQYRKWIEKYRWAVEEKDPYQTNYASNVVFSVIQAKMAELLSWIQEYDFIPLSDEAYMRINLLKEIWKYEWLKTNTDKHLWEAFLSALIAWDGYLYEWMRRIKRKIKVPKEDVDWKITFEEQEIVEREWIYMEYIPWENFYHDWRTIWEANEAIWIKNWDRVEYIKSFENNPNYKNVNEELPIWRYYYNWEKGDLILSPVINDENVVTELCYYNKSKDELIKIVNWIEVYNWCIPYKHKELPFLQYFDYPLYDRACNMGEYELLEKDADMKDALRGLFIDTIKAQTWFTAISPDADFDDTSIELWVNKFARVEPDAIRHFSPNVSTNWFREAEMKVDDDIIIKSWIDFKSQILWASETATKVQAKTQSARKRINLNLKLNSYNFFERLGRLRMANIQSFYWTEAKQIPVKGRNINSEWVQSLCKGFWLYTVTPDHVKWKFNIIPITDSILWASSEREKARILEFAQIAPNFVGADWKPFINMESLIKQITMKLWLDYEELSSSSVNTKSAEEEIRELDMIDDWITPWGMEDPNYIPPEQRSGAKNAKIWWLTNTLPLE